MTVQFCLLLALLLVNPPQESIAPRPEGLAAGYNPGLVDVNGVYVVAEIRQHPTSDPNVSDYASHLAGLIEARLDEAGVSVTPQTLGQFDEATASGMRKIVARRLDVDPNTLRFRMAGIPALRIAVDLMPSEAQTSLALYVRTSFSRDVSLGGRTLPATVWSAEPAMEFVQPSPWPDEVQKVVLEQVESFIAARKAAAPHDGEIPMVSSVPVLRRNAAGASPYPFVASKNSSVFHAAGCPMAGNIAEENLVGYNSRDEAVAAGKRPCKTCNP